MAGEVPDGENRWTRRDRAVGLQTEPAARSSRIHHHGCHPTARNAQEMEFALDGKGEARLLSDSAHRLWQVNDLKLHLTRTFKVSNDPNFEAKFWDLIDL
jgi:hypothetical protein